MQKQPELVITGANGFLGRNCLLGLSDGRRILAMGRRPELPSFVERHGLPHTRTALVDLADATAVAAAAERYGPKLGTVLYLAANGDPARSAADPALDLRDNALALVTFLSHFSVERLIYFSSGAVYDGLSGPVSPSSHVDPRLPYAISKLACEQYIKCFRKTGRVGSYVILRFFGAYGPHEPERKIYTRLTRAFRLEGQTSFTIRGDGRNLIDAMFVDDAVEALRRILHAPPEDLVLDFCSGRPLTLNALVAEAARIFDVTGLQVRHEGHVPEYISFRPSPDALQRQFDFTPRIPLTEGLPTLARHLEEHNHAPD